MSRRPCGPASSGASRAGGSGGHHDRVRSPLSQAGAPFVDVNSNGVAVEARGPVKGLRPACRACQDRNGRCPRWHGGKTAGDAWWTLGLASCEAAVIKRHISDVQLQLVRPPRRLDSACGRGDARRVGPGGLEPTVVPGHPVDVPVASSPVVATEPAGGAHQAPHGHGSMRIGIPFVAVHLACSPSSSSAGALSPSPVPSHLRQPGFRITVFYTGTSHTGPFVCRGPAVSSARSSARRRPAGPLVVVAHHRGTIATSIAPGIRTHRSPTACGGRTCCGCRCGQPADGDRRGARPRQVPEMRFLDRFHHVVSGLRGRLFRPGHRARHVQPVCTRRMAAPGVGFCISTVVLYHSTFAVNSVAHRWGGGVSRPRRLAQQLGGGVADAGEGGTTTTPLPDVGPPGIGLSNPSGMWLIRTMGALASPPSSGHSTGGLARAGYAENPDGPPDGSGVAGANLEGSDGCGHTEAGDAQASADAGERAGPGAGRRCCVAASPRPRCHRATQRHR